MIHGTVKMWNQDKGFGFFVRDDGEADTFCHISSLPERFDGLKKGDRVKFEMGVGKNGKDAAQNVQIVDD